jgi:hypothetical protein
MAFGGSTYVLRQTALELGRAGLAKRVAVRPVIAQPVYACVHLRNRHRGPYRRSLSRHCARIWRRVSARARDRLSHNRKSADNVAGRIAV